MYNHFKVFFYFRPISGAISSRRGKNIEISLSHGIHKAHYLTRYRKWLGSSAIARLTDDRCIPGLNPGRAWVFNSPLQTSEFMCCRLVGGLAEVMLYAAFDDIALFAGCRQVGWAVTARVTLHTTTRCLRRTNLYNAIPKQRWVSR